MILEIVKFPHKALRAKTAPVVFPLSKELKKLTQDMIDTVKYAKGIGLAAPQVDKAYKLIVINLEHLGLPPFALYNPKVVFKGFKKQDMEEGCLSIPEVFGMVKRPMKVTVKAQNERGEEIEITDSGWVSRVAQHEIDHINGVLILDKIRKYTKGQELVKAWQSQNLLN